jgi:two-component system invasion response regulator UvrY
MMKILIADDHALLRHGLIRIILDQYPDAEIDQAASEKQAMPLLREKAFDLILLDLSMPGKGGLEILKDLRSMGIQTPVLIVSMYPEEQYAVRVLKAGASGFLNKDSAPELLIDAIRTIQEGRKFISANVAQQLATGMITGHTDGGLNSLSDREVQVLTAISSGKAVSEIAAELSLSVHTISTYRSRIMDKLGIDSNAALTRFAIDNHLVG